MTAEAAALEKQLGIPTDVSDAHQARYLTRHRLETADLAIAMARDHRREVVELAPAFTRKVFTVRELHRLVSVVSDGDLECAANSAEDQQPGGRLASMLAFVASLRGAAPPPASPDIDDVVDPYRRSSRTYEASVAQIEGALPAVERIVRLALC